MFDLDKWQEILETISKNKLRTFLTAFSVAWGIFILVVLMAAGNGLRNGAQVQFGNDNKNSIWIDAGQTSIPYKGSKPGKNIEFTNDDFYLIKDRIRGIVKATAVYNGGMTGVFTYKKEHSSFTLRSCMPDHQYLENTKMVSGRFINDADILQYRKVCIIGEPVKNTLFKEEDPIGKYIDVFGISFKVVGIFHDDGNGDMNRAYIPLTTAQRIFDGKNKIGTIWVSTPEVNLETSDKLVADIKNKMAQRHHFDPNDDMAIGVYNNNTEFQKIMSMLDGIHLFIIVIGLFTLIAGIVGVSNIMMIIVKERTKEIGVRKALGATPFSILSLIMQESIFITAMAGYIGLVLGVGLVELIKTIGIDSDFFKNPDIDFSIAIWATILLVISGAIAGLIPALKAARVEPVVALRSE